MALLLLAPARVAKAPPNKPGVILYGLGTAAVPFGAGTMCVSAPRYRLGPLATTNANGVVNRPLDFTQPPLSRSGVVLAGTTAYFQFLYRDPGGPAGSQVTLSDGMAVTFCP